MILFLSGQWGAGKSHVARLIQERAALPTLDADSLFTQAEVDAVRTCTLDPNRMEGFYKRVLAAMHAYNQQYAYFMVVQAIYTDRFRRQIFDAFAPNIRFVLIRTPDDALQRRRIDRRATATGNPVSIEAFDHMAQYWEPVSLPHSVILNDDNLDQAVDDLLAQLSIRPILPNSTGASE